MDKNTKKRKGFVLPAVIIFIIFTIMMGLTLLEIGTLENIDANRRTAREKAFYLAEAGVNRAYTQLLANPNWDGWKDENGEPKEEELGDGTYYVEVKEGSFGTKTVYATGMVGQGIETVRLNVFDIGGLMEWGFFGQGAIHLNGNPNVYAVMGSNELIKIDGGGQGYSIHELAAVAEGGTIDAPVGTIWEKLYDQTPVELPPVEIPYMERTQPDEEGKVDDIDGEYAVAEAKDGNGYGFSMKPPDNATIYDGDYRFYDFSIDGELVIDGQVRVHVENSFDMNGGDIILVEASLEIYIGEDAGFDIGGNARINYEGTPSNVRIYSASKDNMTLRGSAVVYAAIYAPKAETTLAQGTPELHGGLVSDRIELAGNVVLQQKIDTSVTPPSGNWGITRRWTKPNWETQF